MRNRLRYVAFVAFFTAATTATAQAPADSTERDAALAARRAERAAKRTERLPTRPVTVRGPLPLPVTMTQPAGGAAAGESCPATESCKINYAVPNGKTLVVTALWSAKKVRCDGASLASPPANGQLVSPWWQCTKSLGFEGVGAGFTGYLAATPTEK